ncbi:MAG TPA: helix-turn-helix domain-containing protein [Chloroflexota bacterium]
MISSLPPTRRQILHHLKTRGEARTEDIATAVGITLQGTRQHLTALERDGLIAHREQRDGLGRPKYVYELTMQGDTLFPRRYADLTNELLGYVQEEDPELLHRIFDRRAHRRLEQTVARTAGMPFSERVRTVAEILDEDGYLADFQDCGDGSFLITEHNCAVLSVAQRYRHACGSELEFLQEAMPEAEVTRIAHRLGGGHVCAYRVVPSPNQE